MSAEATAQRKVRIGFVGVGAMGQKAHLVNYASLDACEVVALAEIREKTGRLVAERYGVPKVYRDHVEMLEAENLDGVVASQPFERHAALLPDLYPRVGHLFTEKPLALSVAAGESLASAAADANCAHMVGYHKRSDPAVRCAKAVADEWRATGRMGGMRYVRITMPEGDWTNEGFVGLLDGGDPRPKGLPVEPPPSDLPETLRGPYRSFVNYYIHQVNLLRHFLGEPYRVTYAEKSGVLLAAESESGVAAAIEMTPYRTTRAWEETVLIGFERGYIRVAIPAPLAVNRAGTVEIYEDPGGGVEPRRVTPAMPWVHAMRNQAETFVKVCRGEAQPPCDAAEAVEDLKIARDYILMRSQSR